MTDECPLCGERRHDVYHTDRRGRYNRCDECALVFLEPARWPALEDELARYTLHRNDAEDADYRRFLAQLAAPMLERLPFGARGLDYGSGPVDVLARMLTDAGRPTVAYDPAFRPDVTALAQRYDFVVCSEVMEHVHQPLELLQRFAGLVPAGGVIGVMTGLYDAAPSFGEWWYLRDPTHVCFYGVDTMHWIADRFGWSVEIRMPNVTLWGV